MRTVDEIHVRAPADRVFAAAADVERWPEILPHYRWVRMLEREARRPEIVESNPPAIVEMAAWRPFGPLNYPTWWVSEMRVDRAARRVLYRHVRGITRGMDVEWRVEESAGGTHVTIVHEWTGPSWPLIGGIAAELVIGPVFIHGIASRTLAGIARAVESSSGPGGNRGTRS